MAEFKSGIDLYRTASSIEKSPRDDGFVKLTEDDQGTSGLKVAHLLMLLGKNEAAQVMAKLSPTEAEIVARRIASTPRVDAVEAKALLEEFGHRFSQMEVRRARGGIEAAKDILSLAFGDEEADKVIKKAVPEGVPKPFSFLNDLEFPQLISLLRKENPTTLSLVMAFLAPNSASRLLESLPDKERSAVVLRMARIEGVSRDVLDTVEETLRDKLRLMGKEDQEELDGRSALADILRFMDLSDEKRLLDQLHQTDPVLADQVKEKLYTMDTVLHLRNRDLQSILSGMTEKDIALLIKGQSPEIKERINGALSSRRRILVADEGDLMGPVPRSEVDAAVKDFLEKLRDGEEKGTYLIIREEEDLIH